MTMRKTIIETKTSKLWAIENFCVNIFSDLVDLPLEIEPPIRSYDGVPRFQRRNVRFFSDVSDGYRYSGQIAKAIPLSPYPILSDMMNVVNETLGSEFNGILVNRYINGDKNIGAHSDDEEFLDKNHKMIATLAFGTVRTFRIRDKRSKKIVEDYEHKSRTLLMMDGRFQNEFTHEIPASKKVKGERISLTFRKHIK